MKKSFWTILLIGAIVSLLGFVSAQKEYSCKKGEYTYAPADYMVELSMKERYKLLFDSLLQKPIYECFCNNDLKGLPGGKQRPKKTLRTISIEPFFIDIKNNDGLYGYRSWNTFGPSVRYRCGYEHYLFIISDNTYYRLTDDSLKNVNILKDKLHRTFSNEELERMIKWDISTNYFCNSNTFDWPILIKKDSKVLWNIDEEIKNN